MRHWECQRDAGEFSEHDGSQATAASAGRIVLRRATAQWGLAASPATDGWIRVDTGDVDDAIGAVVERYLGRFGGFGGVLWGNTRHHSHSPSHMHPTIPPPCVIQPPLCLLACSFKLPKLAQSVAQCLDALVAQLDDSSRQPTSVPPTPPLAPHAPHAPAQASRRRQVSGPAHQSSAGFQRHSTPAMTPPLQLTPSSATNQCHGTNWETFNLPWPCGSASKL